jgi:hypothetical protein
MGCSDIVCMVVSPCSSHSFGIFVIWHDVRVVRELLVTDRTYPVLFDNLAIQQFPHFSRGSEFPISSRAMRIFDTLHAEAYLPGLVWDGLPATAGKRFVQRTVLIATKPHGSSPVNGGGKIRCN